MPGLSELDELGGHQGTSVLRLSSVSPGNYSIGSPPLAAGPAFQNLRNMTSSPLLLGSQSSSLWQGNFDARGRDFDASYLSNDEALSSSATPPNLYTRELSPLQERRQNNFIKEPGIFGRASGSSTRDSYPFHPVVSTTEFLW